MAANVTAAEAAIAGEDESSMEVPAPCVRGHDLCARRAGFEIRVNPNKKVVRSMRRHGSHHYFKAWDQLARSAVLFSSASTLALAPG